MPDYDELDQQYQKFLSQQCHPSRVSVPSESTPDRPTVALSDLHKPGGPAATETHGAMLRPMMVHRYGPDVASPAPFVSTSIPEAFKYREVGTGRVVTPGPRKADES